MEEMLGWLCSERQDGAMRSSRLSTESKNLRATLPLIVGSAGCGISRRPDAKRTAKSEIIEPVGVKSASMEVMKVEEESEETDGPWVLPVVRHGATQYFVDLRLRQFRNVQKPHECWDFESEEGKQMCERCGIVMCRECRMAAIVSPALDRKELRCMNCLALIVPRVRV